MCLLMGYQNRAEGGKLESRNDIRLPGVVYKRCEHSLYERAHVCALVTIESVAGPSGVGKFRAVQ